jgi:hypothetical protein
MMKVRTRTCVCTSHANRAQAYLGLDARHRQIACGNSVQRTEQQESARNLSITNCFQASGLYATSCSVIRKSVLAGDVGSRLEAQRLPPRCDCGPGIATQGNGNDVVNLPLAIPLSAIVSVPLALTSFR